MLLIMHACGAGAAVPSNTRFTVIHRGGARMECGARTCTRRRGLDEVRRCFRRGLNRPGNGTQLARGNGSTNSDSRAKTPLFLLCHQPQITARLCSFLSRSSFHQDVRIAWDFGCISRPPSCLLPCVFCGPACAYGPTKIQH